ncbi:hypothetical protein [Micromonospora zamorensis]
MRHSRDIPSLDVQHLVLNPPDIADTKEDWILQRQGEKTAAGTAGQPFQVIHQLHPTCGDGLGHHATILPVCAAPTTP